MPPKTFAYLIGLLLFIATPIMAQETLPPLEPITPDNVMELEMLAQLGTGMLSPAFAWSPDGAELAVGGTLGISLYDTSDYTQPPQFVPTAGFVDRVGYSADGRLMAYVANNMVYLLDKTTSETIVTFEHSTIFAFQPSGDLFAVGRAEYLRETDVRAGYFASHIDLWDVQKQEVINSIAAGADQYGQIFVRLAFSPDSRTIAASWTTDEYSTCGERSVYFNRWSIAEVMETPDETPTSREGKDPNRIYDGYDFAFNPVGSQVAVLQWDDRFRQASNLIDYYDFADAEAVVRRLEPITINLRDTGFYIAPPITAITFSPDGKALVTVSNEDILQILNIHTGELQKEWLLNFSVEAIAYNPNGSRLAAAGDGRVWVLDSTSGQVWTTLGSERTRKSGLVNDDGTAMMARDADGLMHLWVIEGNTIREQPLREIDHKFELRFTPHPSLLMVTNDRRDTIFWDFTLNQASTPDDAYLMNERDMVFSPNGYDVALLQGVGVIEIYNTTTGELQTTLAGNFQASTQIQFSPDSSQILTTQFFDVGDYGSFSHVKLWNVATGEMMYEYGTSNGEYGLHFRGEAEARFSQDGTKIAVNNQYAERVSGIWESKTVMTIYDMAEGEVLFTKEQTGDRHGRLSPDFSIYASDLGDTDWGTTNVELFDTANGDRLPDDQKYIYDSDGGGVYVFSPDGDQLLVRVTSINNCGGDYRAFKLYDARTAEEIARIGLPSAMLGWGSEDISFSPDGDLLITSTEYAGEIVDTESGEELGYLRGLNSSELHFNADQTLLIATRQDGTITIWGVPKAA